MLREKLTIKILRKKLWLKTAWQVNLDKCFSKSEPKILVVSLYKSGTHLIKNVLSQVGLKSTHLDKGYSSEDFLLISPGWYLLSHYPPGVKILELIEQRKIKVVFNYRDPRDICVSKLNWINAKNKKVTLPIREYEKKIYSHLSDKKLLNLIIDGEKYLEHSASIDEMFRLSRSLLFHPSVLKVKFEDLVGPKGGGKKKAQIKTIKGLMTYLEIKASKKKINKIANKAFSIKAKTFSKGKVGRYKSVFTKTQLKRFNKLYKDILRDYKYL